MTRTATLLHAQEPHLPMALDQATAVLGVAALVLVGVAYLFYSDYRAVFWQVER